MGNTDLPQSSMGSTGTFAIGRMYRFSSELLSSCTVGSDVLLKEQKVLAPLFDDLRQEMQITFGNLVASPFAKQPYVCFSSVAGGTTRICTNAPTLFLLRDTAPTVNAISGRCYDMIATNFFRVNALNNNHFETQLIGRWNRSWKILPPVTTAIIFLSS
jgi:hypothetical protein